VDKNSVTINEYNEDKTLMMVADPDFKPEKELVIYGLLDKYIEVDLEVVEEYGPGYFKCKIKGARRAIEGRKDLRFKLEGEAVATNFKISKHTIDVSRFNIPTSIKVVLEQFQSVNMKFSDKFIVDVIAADTKDIMLKNIRNSGKTLFVSDVSNIDSYKAVSDDFIDVAKIYGHELNQLVMRNLKEGYKSIIIVPVVYITENGTNLPFAFIQAISKEENFGIDKVFELKEMSLRLVDRIRDANTLHVSAHQKIVDIGRGGAKIKIDNGELKKYIQKSKGFVFDIVFKLQAPMTIYGEIKAISTDSDGNIFLGVDFEGNSSRKDELKRFYDVLKPMEADYKARLIKSMKNKR
jgi:hypothetical protein